MSLWKSNLDLRESRLVILGSIPDLQELILDLGAEFKLQGFDFRHLGVENGALRVFFLLLWVNIWVSESRM